MFSYGFSFEPENLQPQNRCFVRGFRQFSSHRTKCHACHGSSTCHHLTQPWQCDSQKHDTSKVPGLPQKLELIFWNRHTKQLSTRYRTPLNITKCHTCHAKQSNATFETSKSDAFCRTCHRHGHSDLARTVATSRERLRTVADGWGQLGNVERKHTLNPQTPRVKREPLHCYAFGKNYRHDTMFKYSICSMIYKIFLHQKLPSQSFKPLKTTQIRQLMCSNHL